MRCTLHLQDQPGIQASRSQLQGNKRKSSHQLISSTSLLPPRDGSLPASFIFFKFLYMKSHSAASASKKKSISFRAAALRSADCQHGQMRRRCCAGTELTCFLAKFLPCEQLSAFLQSEPALEGHWPCAPHGHRHVALCTLVMMPAAPAIDGHH